jgi:putative hydrolase of the HAD superfamily
VKLLEARREVVAGTLAALARAGRRTPAGDFGRRIADRFTAYRDEQMGLFPDAIAVLDALRAHGVRLGLVTNGAGEAQRAKLARFDLAGRFDHIQIEGEAGFGKPDERAYLHALQVLNSRPHETWMVGDHLEWEVNAPQRLGIHAIWFDPDARGLPHDAQARPDRTIRSLSELLPDAAGRQRDPAALPVTEG